MLNLRSLLPLAVLIMNYKRMSLIAAALLVCASGYLAIRGSHLQREADAAEAIAIPAALVEGRSGAQLTQIEQAFRGCVGQAVLDDVKVAVAAPECARRLSQVLPAKQRP